MVKTTDQPLTKEEIAKLIATDIQPGAFVNLGIGQPTTVADFLTPEKQVTLHTENGMLGMGPQAHDEQIDEDLINAGKIPVTENPGAAFFHHADSFAMMRGGHLDVCVLGAYQVSAKGDLANWSTGKEGAIPAVGGAMDLAIGAKDTYVMMDLLTKKGQRKLMKECTFPLTGVQCVSRIYSDMGVFLLDETGVVKVRELHGITQEKLQEIHDDIRFEFLD